MPPIQFRLRTIMSVVALVAFAMGAMRFIVWAYADDLGMEFLCDLGCCVVLTPVWFVVGRLLNPLFDRLYEAPDRLFRRSSQDTLKRSIEFQRNLTEFESMRTVGRAAPNPPPKRGVEEGVG